MSDDPWKKYDKEMKEKLKEHPTIINAINTMRDRGFSKEYAQKVSGAPYEIVDRLYKHGQKQKNDGPAPGEED